MDISSNAYEHLLSVSIGEPSSVFPFILCPLCMIISSSVPLFPMDLMRIFLETSST